MAPYEAFGEDRGGLRGALDAVLERGRGSAIGSDPVLVRAYRARSANDQHFPNTAEVLAAILHREALSGVKGPAAAIFSYSMQPPERRAFREATSEVLDSLRIPLVRIAIRANGGNFHEGVVVLNSERLHANLRRRVEALRRLGAEWHWDP